MLATFGFASAHVPNGAQLAGDRLARIRQVAALRADGLMPGFPDLVVFGREYGISFGRVGFMEVKRAQGGVVSAEQTACHQWMQARGCPLAVVRSGEEAIAALYDWGWM